MEVEFVAKGVLVGPAVIFLGGEEGMVFGLGIVQEVIKRIGGLGGSDW